MRATALAILVLSLLAPRHVVAQDEDGRIASDPPPAPTEPPNARPGEAEATSTTHAGERTDTHARAGEARSASTRAGTAPNADSPAGRSSTGASPSGGRANFPEREEDEDEPKDDDPYDLLWVELIGGLSYVDLRAIDADNFYPSFVRLSGVGPAGGLAAGFRIDFLSVGLRGALAHYGEGFEVGTAVAEVALALPIPIVKPFVRAGFGFGWHGDSNAEEAMIPRNAQTTVFGWAFAAAVGLDVYLTSWFAIGAAFNLDILNMSRQSFDDPVGNPGDVVFEDTGDAVGLQARGQLSVSFHL